MPNYGEYGLDNTRFKRDIEEAKAALNGIGKTAEQNASTMDSAFKKAGQMAAGYFSIQAAAGFVSQLVQVRGEFQKLEVGFTTMLGSKEKSNQLMAQMVDTAMKTPFTLQEVAGGAKQLLAYQVAQKDINQTLIELGNISAGLGVPIGRLIMVYGQVKAKGKLMGDDLRQFTEAGVPMVHELAKQMGVADSEVTKLITSGKVGFPEVQAVIHNLTGEGGMFFNLMAAQSLTVTGQLSNLQDAWSKMLNQIGADNDGLIYGAISGVSSLITNYETVGRIIESLIITYGVYKAALMVSSVATAVELGLTRQQIVSNLGKVASLATATTATQAQTIATIQGTTAQSALNAVIMANPYVFLIAGIVAVVGAMWALQDNTTAQEAAQQRLNDTTDEATKKKDELSNRTQALTGTINDQNRTLLAQVTAFEELKNKYPELLANLDLQMFKALGATEQQKLLNKAMDEGANKDLDQSIQDAKSAVGTAKDKAQPLNQGAVEAFNDSLLNATGLNLIFATNQVLAEREVETAEIYLKKLQDQKAAKEEMVRLAAIEALPEAEKLAYYEKQLQALKNQRDLLKNSADAAYTAAENAKKVNSQLNILGEQKDVPLMLTATDFILKGINGKIDELENKLHPKTAPKDKADWTKTDWETEKKKADEAWEATTAKNTAKEKAAIKARVDAAKKALSAWDISDSSANKAESRAEKNAKEKERLNKEIAANKLTVEKQTADLLLQNEQDRINLLPDGYAKELEQLKFNNTKKQAEIAKAAASELAIYQKLSDEKWVLTAPRNKKGEIIGKNPNKAVLPLDAVAAYGQATDNSNAALVKGRQDMYNKLIDSYADYAMQKEKIDKKYTDDEFELNALMMKLSIKKSNGIASAEDLKMLNDTISALNKLKENYKTALTELQKTVLDDPSNGKGLLDLYLYGDGTTFINEKIKEIIPSFQSFADLTVTELEKVKALLPTLGLTDAQKKALKDAGIDVGKLLELLKKATGDAGKLTDLEKWTKISDTVSTLAQSVGELGTALQISEGVLGEIGKVLSSLGASADKFMSVIKESKTLDKNGKLADPTAVISSGISGIADIYSMVATQIEANKKAQDDWNASIKEAAYQLELLKIDELAYKEATIFGVENPYSQAIAGAKQYAEATRDLYKKTQELENGKTQTGTKNVVNWDNAAKGAGAGAVTGAAVGTLLAAFTFGASTLIGAGIGALVGGIIGLASTKTEPVFDSLKNKYDSILKDGKLNPQILADYGKLDDATKKLVDGWKDLKAKQDEAQKAMEDNFKALAGDLGKSLSDSLVEAFSNGDLYSAIDKFDKKVNDVIAGIVQQLIFNQVFGQMFTDLGNAFKASFGANGDQNIVDDIEKFDKQYKEGLDVYGKLINAANTSMKFDGFAGFDTATRTATAKGIATASQDSVDENNGRLTAIQGHTFQINESVKVLAANSPKILLTLMGIKGDTANLVRLENIENSLSSVKQGISDINMKGIYLKV